MPTEPTACQNPYGTPALATGESIQRGDIVGQTAGQAFDGLSIEAAPSSQGKEAMFGLIARRVTLSSGFARSLRCSHALCRPCLSGFMKFVDRSTVEPQLIRSGHEGTAVRCGSRNERFCQDISNKGCLEESH